MQFKLHTYLYHLLDLRHGAEDKHIIIENVKDDGDFSSARFWTLVAAIGVASVGLNINSIPVVIGAMLISPLMGPIVSMGLALAIYDWGLLRRSFRNLLILTASSIVISAIYFSLTPITAAQSELLSRTQPTIFDVLIAIFGGIAGFIAISRAKQGYVIAGVAIATALIPPLCTVGYGIATLQLVFIFGAFYLFLINCIFICLASLLVAKYLKLPKHEYPDEIHRRRVSRVITSVIIIITLPATYLAYTFVGESHFNTNADHYITSVFTDNGHIVVYENKTYTRTTKSIELAFLDEHFTPEEIATFEDRLKDYGLSDVTLVIKQNNASPEAADWNKLLSDLKGSEAAVTALQSKLDSERKAADAPTKLLAELRSFAPEITDIAIGSFIYGTDATGIATTTALIDHGNTSLVPDVAETITTWLRHRLSDETMRVIFIPPVTAPVVDEASSTIGR